MKQEEIKKIGKQILKHIKGEIITRSEIKKFIIENTVKYERDQKSEGVSTDTQWDIGYNACLENLQGTFIGE